MLTSSPRRSLVALLWITVLGHSHWSGPIWGVRPAHRDRPTVDTPVASTSTRSLAFGWWNRIGPQGRGMQTLGLELGEIQTVGNTIEVDVVEYRDALIENSADRRTRTKDAHWRQTGDQLEYVFHPQAGRTVTVTLDGDLISHRNEGLGPEKSRLIPESMPGAMILEEELVTSFQLFFERLLPESGVAGLPGLRRRVIVPGRLGVYDVRLEGGATETLHLPGGDLETTIIDVIREEPERGGRQRNAALDLRRRFWLAAGARIVRFEIPIQARQQAPSFGYNLADNPKFFGVRSEEIVLDASQPQPGRPCVFGSADRRRDGKPRPALLVIHEDSRSGRAVAEFLRWHGTAGGLHVATTPGSADLANRLGGMVGALAGRADVKATKVFLTTVGSQPEGLSSALATLGIAGWIAVNPSGPPWNAEPPTLPTLVISADSGDGAAQRKHWLESYPRSSDVVRLRNVDDNLEYLDTVLSEAPRDEFGLAFGFLRSLEIWFGKALAP